MGGGGSLEDFVFLGGGFSGGGGVIFGEGVLYRGRGGFSRGE